MTSEVAEAARRLLTPAAGDDRSPVAVAGRVANAFERLSHHLARLVGDLGVRTMFDRSLALTSARYPWLASARSSRNDASERAWSSLSTVMAQHEPAVTIEAAVLVLSTFIGLLERLIGATLVARLLEEVWPAMFGSDKGTP